MTPEQKQKILKVCKKFHFDFAVLFGSSSQKSQFARDHDIAFYSRKKTASELSLKLSSDLYPFFTKPVDIIILTSTTDPLLSYEIAHKGELICELKKESFLQFPLHFSG